MPVRYIGKGGNMMLKAFSIITFILVIITCGCGFVIHYGGKPFEGAIKGHMILGVLTLLSVLVLMGGILINKK